MTHYLDAAEKIATDVVAKNAHEIDRGGVYPDTALEALRDSGLLGLISARNVGGMGEGPRAAATVVERFARECGSTAMVTCMHYAAAAVIEKFGSDEIRKELAAGKHVATLAFSEAGSRSHFWAVSIERSPRTRSCCCSSSRLPESWSESPCSA